MPDEHFLSVVYNDTKKINSGMTLPAFVIYKSQLINQTANNIFPTLPFSNQIFMVLTILSTFPMSFPSQNLLITIIRIITTSVIPELEFLNEQSEFRNSSSGIHNSKKLLKIHKPRKQKQLYYFQYVFLTIPFYLPFCLLFNHRIPNNATTKFN